MQEPQSRVPPAQRRNRKSAFRFSSRKVLRQSKMRSTRRYEGIDKVTCTPDFDRDMQPSQTGPLESVRGKFQKRGRGRGKGKRANTTTSVELVEDGALVDGGESRTTSEVSLCHTFLHLKCYVCCTFNIILKETSMITLTCRK